MPRESDMRIRNFRRSAVLAVLVGAGVVFAIGDATTPNDHGFVASAHAQPLRKLIARLRGETLPAGVVKAQGRIEATQVDVSPKYSGQLAEISVGEGSRVRIGQVIARLSSPEREAELRAAQSDLSSAQNALASAEFEIDSRKAALQFAKSEFERGQELIKTGFITKQAFEERQRNFEAADATLKTMIAQKDQAQSAIKAAEARVQEVQSVIHDLTIVSPRNGRVQYQLARLGETTAVGQPIMTVLDLTDLYMVIFLPAAEAGKLGMGDEARIVLDAVPDYVIPAKVSFVASDSQFTPKTVETEDERAKLMFRVKLRIDRDVVQRYTARDVTGLKGSGFVLTKPDAKWPPELEVKLPPAPIADADSPAPVTQEPAAAPPASGPSIAPAPPSVAETSPAASTPPAPVAQAPAPAPVAPVAEAQTPPAPAPIAQAAAPIPTEGAQSSPPAPAPAPQAETPASPAERLAEAPPPAAQEPAAEFAPDSLAQLMGAWAPSVADCDRLFQKRGRALAFRQPVDKFAQAAIVEPQRVRLPSAVCEIDRAAQEGGALKVSADCQDSISYTSRTVYIKLRSDTEVFFSPTGDPVLATTLMKCPL
jgi:HlyD family secretion protein